MIKKLTIAALICLPILACLKGKMEPGSVTPPAPQVTPTTLDTMSVPSSFKQNLFFETFTATWCGYCPREDYFLDTSFKRYPTRMFAAMCHQTDPFSIPQDDTLATFFSVTGIPDAPFNYCTAGVYSYTSFLGNVPQFGVAVGTTLSSDSCSVKVAVGFSQSVSQNMNLVVMVVEDNISGSAYDQANYYDSDATSPYYLKGDPIKGFVHNNVLREVISSSCFGDIIPAASTQQGMKYIKNYKFQVSSLWNKSNLKIIAFVCDGQIKTNPSSLVFNVNQARIGSTVLW